MLADRPAPLLAAVLLSLTTLAGATPQGLEVSANSGAWPQWRGPARDGSAPGPAWPADLSPEHLKESWRATELGPSYSGPVLDEERVYTTESLDRKSEVVRAFRRDSGEELWKTSWEGSMSVPFFAAKNGSWVRSTPTVDGDSLYVAGMRDVLKCLDVRTGEVRWSVDFMERFESGLPPFGCVPSPLLTDSHLFMQAGSGVVKLDKKTGATVWRSMVSEGDMMTDGAFSSPVIAKLAGKDQLVVQSRTELAGLDLEDGRVLWSTPVKAFRGMNILTPTILGDGVFTSTYGGRSYRFGVEEGEAGLEVAKTWDSGIQGYMTSPVVVNGHAYLFLKSNRFGCLELETGERSWISGPTGDSYWSLAVQEERILALSDSGMLRLIRADPTEYAVLSERQLEANDTWAHVAPAGGQLFVRAKDALIAYEWK